MGIWTTLALESQFCTMPTRVTTKSVYDLSSKELRSRAEVKLDNGTKIGVNLSDKDSLVSIDWEKGAYKAAYDYKRKDIVMQFTRKYSAGTFKVKQLVPEMRWEVLPTPVVELSTKLFDKKDWKDSLKFTYDFQNRTAFYTETLKFHKKYKVRIAGETKTSDHSFCLGYKPDKKWLKSVKVSHTPVAGPLLTYKFKPAAGWKVATEASLDRRQLAGSITYKALQGDAELVFDALVPFGEEAKRTRFVKKAGIKVDLKI